MSLSDSLTWVARQFRARGRRSYITGERAHIEFRQAEGAELEELTRHIEHGFAKLDGVRWVEVNPFARRVIVCYEPFSHTREELERVVELAERATYLDRPDAAEWGPPHPADEEPIERLFLELGADLASLVLGLALRLSPIPHSAVASNALGVVAVLNRTRVRSLIEERVGRERFVHIQNLLISALQAAAQRPSSSFIDLLHRRVLLREEQARREVWVRREPELCREKAEHPATRWVESRPIPMPRGPVEEYADRAWMLSLAGFGVSFVATRNLQRAVAALYGALPKPARLGRDVFSSELGSALAARNVLVLDPYALRRLDRVDTLVLQGDMISHDRFELGEVVASADVEAAEVRRRVEALFDSDNAADTHSRDGWALGPAAAHDLDGELAIRSTTLARRGALVLALTREHRVVAVVEMRVIPQTGAEELISAAHEAGMRVVLAGDEALLQGINADDTIPTGIGLKAGIRRLQRQGRTVCLVATGNHSEALISADFAIGLTRAGEAPPWGADLVCDSDLGVVRFLLHASATAREVSKQSVNIALGSATLGALVAAGGVLPSATRYVITVVNGASLVSMTNALRASGELERSILPQPRDRTPWHALDAQGVLYRLGSTEHGLGRSELVRRLPLLPRVRPAALELFDAITDELFNPLAPLLAAGAGLSAVVGSMSDASMVAGVVALNAVVGGLQRFATERAIRDLSRSARHRAAVRRAGVRVEVEASELVCGDVIELRSGDVVPADCRILEAVSLEIDASSLTGESLPVKKTAAPSFASSVADRASMLYEGTSVAAGRATAVVVAVGDATEAKRAVAAAPLTRTQSGVDLRLRSLINLTGPVALASGAGLVGLGLLRGRRLEDLIGSGVSLAVASVPEGLPLLATAAQLASAKRLAKRGALVRNTRSLEALGRVQVLCVDKTGTVTEGRIELHSLTDGVIEETVPSLSGERRGALAAALRATSPSRRDDAGEDPTDVALLRACGDAGVALEQGYPGYRRESELSFEAGRGYHAVYGRHEHGALLSVKGAPEVLLRQCGTWLRDGRRTPLDPVETQQLHVLAGLLARRGLRVLAVAERELAHDEGISLGQLEKLTFRGLLAFSDPVRSSAMDALDRVRRAGVRSVMLTGDHPSTARAIAAELGLDGDVVSGSDLLLMSDSALDARLERIAIFARVTPSQKVRVVRAFQRTGHVVAMVGDGANDAPAIRLADVGIAIGERSTSAARGAADVVVTDDRIETLVEAIVEGRAMWASVRDAVSILVGGNLGEIGFTLAGGLIDGKPPLNPRQLLLVNLLTDVAPAMAIALRPTNPEDMESLAQEGPEASLGEPLNRDIAGRAIVTAAGAGLAWGIGRLLTKEERARTIGLVALVGTQLGQTLVSGGTSRAVLGTSAASAAALAAIVQTPGVSRFFGCQPLGPLGWSIAVGSSAAATGASVLVPKAIAQIASALRLDEVMRVEEPAEELAPIAGLQAITAAPYDEPALP